jgi:predicted Zn-dependent protease
VSEEFSVEAQAGHPSLGNQLPAGKLSPLQWTLRFEPVESGCDVLEMPFQDLRISIDGQLGRIEFQHPKFPDRTIFTWDLRILEHRAFTQRTHLRNQIQAFTQRQVWRQALIVTVACLTAFALLCVLVSWASGYMVRALAAQVPARWEKEYGDKLFSELKQEVELSSDPDMNAQLMKATQPLLRVVKGDFQFHLVENPTPNAAALPGGHVLVDTGLLKMVSSPEELAGVLAHELAHVTQKHHFRQEIADKGPYYVTRLFFHKKGLVSLLAMGSHLLLRQNFSRKYEREADDVGWAYLVEANINPLGEIEVLKKLKAEEEKRGRARLTQSGFSSHPPTEERIQRLETRWSKLKKRTGFLEFDKPE